jgi:FkbH-like protein
VNAVPDAVRRILAETAAASLPEKIAAVRRIEALGAPFAQHASVRFLRNYTIEGIAPLLKFHSFHHEIDAAVSFASFDTFEQEVWDPSSITRTERHDVIVLTLWLEGLVEVNQIGDLDVSTIFERLKALIDGLIGTTTSEIVVTSFLPPFYSRERPTTPRRADSLTARIRELNQLVFDLVRTRERLHLIDLTQLMAVTGEHAALDTRFWYLYRAPFKSGFLDEMALEVAGLLAALKGRSKKVLVLDCDNTLWGGIVGEDGIDGIALDPAKYPGSAFYDFQRQILALKRQGVLLALCSKNNESDVTAVFDQHPHCLLKAGDFAAARVNWQDKRRNLMDLAKALNLGIDSLVFIDDSDVECEFIRTTIPEVTVLQVPARTHELPSLLKRYRGFDRISQTAEDLDRAGMYRDEACRAEEQKHFSDVKAYLRSLNLTVQLGSVRPPDVARAAQLTQKTNQFNLTTRRYTEGEIERFRNSPDHKLVMMRVRDRFGDYGITGLGMVVRDGATARIELFLMSCRVLGRNVEDALLRRLMTDATAWPGVRVIEGLYVPTPKNSQVAAFYPSRGFAATDTVPDDCAPGTRAFVFDAGVSLPEVPDFLSVAETVA